MAGYRVLVVDDSAFMRKIFSDIIDGDPDFTVIGTAGTGKEAVEQVARLRPDAVTMDLEMPVMNGYEALRRIMSLHPVPVIMLSGISEEGLRETIKALQFGAFDFIHKPDTGSIDIKSVAEQLISRLRAAMQTKRRFTPAESPGESGHPLQGARKTPTPGKPVREAPPSSSSAVHPQKGRKEPSPLPRTDIIRLPVKEPVQQPGKKGTAGERRDGATGGTPPKAVPRKDFRDIVAIGTSTGGPRALHTVLTALPRELRAPVLVVQHMPPKFTLSLAQRLDSFAELHVREAAEGEQLEAGVVYIAPGGKHMTVAKDSAGYRIRLTEEGARGGHRPSVDVLFESLLERRELKRHVVLMTGMGSDGAEAMKALTEQGIPTAIAESEETCVVYGMPRSAVERGAAKEIVPLQDIAPRLVDAVMK